MPPKLFASLALFMSAPALMTRYLFCIMRKIPALRDPDAPRVPSRPEFAPPAAGPLTKGEPLPAYMRNARIIQYAQ
jgi:hypothetical protein